MHIIRVRFESFRCVHLGDLFGACGVYVLWDGRARARPRYIGEGNILKRLADHWDRPDVTFALPLDGYVAIIGDHGHVPSKLEARAVEYLLLEIGGYTDRGPGANRHPGNQTAVIDLCRKFGTLRVAVSGFDPLCPPWEARPLKPVKQIKARLTAADQLCVEQTWRLRKLRRMRR